MPQDPSGGGTVEISQESLTKITKAVEDGLVNGLGGLPKNNNPVGSGNNKDKDTSLGTDRNSLFTGVSSEEGMFDRVLKFSSRILGQLSDGTLKGLQMMYNQLDANTKLSKDLEGQLAYFYDARKKLGNISFDLETGAAEMEGITKQYVEQCEAEFISATD